MTRINLVLSAALCAALASFGSNASAIEIAVNGGLETGDLTGWTSFESAPGQQTVTSINPSSGSFALEIDNQVDGTNSLIKQANLAAGQLTGGQAITISFDARGELGVGAVAFAQIFSELDGGGVSKAEFVGGGPLGINADPSIWTPFSITTTLGPDVSGGVTLQLEAVTAAIIGSTNTMYYDNISIQVDSLVPLPNVPEPTSLALVGLAGLAAVAGRRRNA